MSDGNIFCVTELIFLSLCDNEELKSLPETYQWINCQTDNLRQRHMQHVNNTQKQYRIKNLPPSKRSSTYPPTIKKARVQTGQKTSVCVAQKQAFESPKQWLNVKQKKWRLRVGFHMPSSFSLLCQGKALVVYETAPTKAESERPRGEEDAYTRSRSSM